MGHHANTDLPDRTQMPALEVRVLKGGPPSVSLSLFQVSVILRRTGQSLTAFRSLSHPSKGHLGSSTHSQKWLGCTLFKIRVMPVA